MEELTLTTPALLFSAISLIMLAYTNRFLAYAAVIRDLHNKYKKKQRQGFNCADNKYKTTPVPNTKHANFWYFQFITLCIDHVFNLHPTTYPSGLGVWCSPYFIDYIVGTVNYGNSNFSKSTGASY